jgi:signal transduction histidine kinase
VSAEEFFNRVHPEDLPRLRRMLDRVMKAGAGFDHEFRIVRPDGSVRWLAGKGRLLRDASEQPEKMIGVNYDITARKEAEGQLRMLARTLEQRVAERTADLEAANRALREEMGHRRQLESEILSVSEREQRRIGQDLHDGLCQMTTATAMMSEGLARDLRDRSLPEEAQAARRITKLIQSVGEEARRLSHGLSPVDREAEGLMRGLESLALSTRNLFHVSCRFRCPTPVLVADHAVAIHLFRIAQEAVNNAVRHARPRQIQVTLERNPTGLVLAVADDGSGFPRKLSPRGGMGLNVMRYRAGMIGGTLRVERGPRRGTIVSCVLAETRSSQAQSRRSPNTAKQTTKHRAKASR